MNIILVVLYFLANLLGPRPDCGRPPLAPAGVRPGAFRGRLALACEWIPSGWKLQGCPPPSQRRATFLNHALELTSRRLTRSGP